MAQLSILLKHSKLRDVAVEILAFADKDCPTQCSLNIWERHYVDEWGLP